MVKKIIFSFIVVILFLLIIEGGLRLIKFKFDLNLAQFGDFGLFLNKKVFLLDKKLKWKFKPDIKFDTSEGWKLPYTINSHGFRGPDFKTKKEKGTKRIIFMGDSITFGQMVKYKNIYSSAVKRLLKKDNVEVINAGVVGYSSQQGRILLKEYILKYQPDIIGIFYGWNDFIGSSVFSDNENRIQFPKLRRINNTLSSHLKIVQLFNKLFFTIKFKKMQNERFWRKSRVNYKDYKDNISDIVTVAREHSIKVILINSPGRLEDLIKYDAILKKFVNNKDVYFADLISAMNKLENKSSYFIDFNHVNKEGHLIYAEQICRILIPLIGRQ